MLKYNNFVGSIDEIQIWSRVLNPSDVTRVASLAVTTNNYLQSDLNGNYICSCLQGYYGSSCQQTCSACLGADATRSCTTSPSFSCTCPGSTVASPSTGYQTW
jgi:hypothetical protein